MTVFDYICPPRSNALTFQRLLESTEPQINPKGECYYPLLNQCTIS